MRTEVPFISVYQRFVYHSNKYHLYAKISYSGAKTKTIQDLYPVQKRHLAFRIEIFLQAPKYPVTIVNRFTYVSNKGMKNTAIFTTGPYSPDSHFSPYDLWFGSDTYTNYLVTYH